MDLPRAKTILHAQCSEISIYSFLIFNFLYDKQLRGLLATHAYSYVNYPSRGTHILSPPDPLRTTYGMRSFKYCYGLTPSQTTLQLWLILNRNYGN